MYMYNSVRMSIVIATAITVGMLDFGGIYGYDDGYFFFPPVTAPTREE